MEHTEVSPEARPLIQGEEQAQQFHPPPAPPSYDQATSPATPAQTSGPAITLSEPSPAGHTIVIMPAPTTVYGPAPMDIQCPYCHNYTRTKVRFQPNSRTHLIAALLCLFQLYCCVCLPYCIGSCMVANHYCGMCDHYLGTHQRN